MRKSRKKGAFEFEMIWFIGQGLVLMLVLTSGLMFLNNAFSNSGIEKVYLTRDLSLLLSISLSMPGNLFYVYPTQLAKYDFAYDINNGEVRIKLKKDTMWDSYPYGIDHNINVPQFTSSGLSALFISKNGNEIKLAGTGIRKGNAMTCPNIDSNNPSWQSQNIYVNMSKVLKDNLYPSLKYKSSIFSDSYDASLQKTTLILNSSKSINGDDKGVTVFVRSDSEKTSYSQKMGCFIANEISNNIHLDYLSVVLVDSKDSTIDPKVQKALSLSENSLYITITDNIKDYNKLSDSIFNGIKKYYEDNKK